MKKIIAVVQGKGGVGKSTTSESICFTLNSLGHKFKLIEIDVSNTSHNLKNSLIFKDTVELISDVQDSSILNKLIKANIAEDVITVLDIGSGTDTLYAIEQFHKVAYIPIKYIIPIDSSLRNLKNATDAIEKIGRDKDINFVLNKVFDQEKLKSQFIFFYGDKKKRVPSFKDKYPDFKFATIPYSNNFELASIDSFSIADLAQISRDVNMEDAVNIYQKKFLIDSNDDEGFDIAITNYIKSQDAKVDVDATIASLASILEIDAV